MQRKVIKDEKAIIHTCTLCYNFCPLTSVCKIDNEPCKANDSIKAKVCVGIGRFVRYLPIIPDFFNYFSDNDDCIPRDWMRDYSRVPNDAYGSKLIVRTKRGYEIAIPANDSVNLLADPLFGMVEPVFTFQGQRELIFTFGIDIAKKETEEKGVELTVLPGEESCQGDISKINAYFFKKGLSNPSEERRLSDQNSSWGW